jgi:hypothetical protein
VAYDALVALGAVGEDVLADLGVLKPAPDSSIYRIVGVGEEPGVFGEQMADAIKALVKGSLLRSRKVTSTWPSNLFSLRWLSHVVSGRS